MTKTDFAELKEKLMKFDADKFLSVKIYSVGDVSIDAARSQHTLDAAIISELVDIIKSQSEHLKMSQRYLLVNNPKTSVGDRTKLMKAIHSSLSETTTRLQKLRDGK